MKLSFIMQVFKYLPELPWDLVRPSFSVIIDNFSTKFRSTLQQLSPNYNIRLNNISRVGSCGCDDSGGITDDEENPDKLDVEILHFENAPLIWRQLVSQIERL